MCHYANPCTSNPSKHWPFNWVWRETDRETDREILGRPRNLRFQFRFYSVQTDRNRPTFWGQTEKPTEPLFTFGSQHWWQYTLWHLCTFHRLRMLPEFQAIQLELQPRFRGQPLQFYVCSLPPERECSQRFPWQREVAHFRSSIFWMTGFLNPKSSECQYFFEQINSTLYTSAMGLFIEMQPDFGWCQFSGEVWGSLS